MIIQFLFSGKNKRSVYLLLISFAGLVCTFLLAGQASAQAIVPGSEDVAILQSSKPLVTRAGAWQTWNDHIHLKQGQENVPLALYFINGADGRPKFTDLRVFLARNPVATLKDFGGNDTLSLNLAGKVTRGNTALAVQGFGPSGARLIWQVLARRPVVTAVNPKLVRFHDKIIVLGRNFSERSQDVKVLVGTKPAKILSLTSSEIQLKPPPQISGGSHDLVVVVHSIKSNAVKIEIKSNPRITLVDPLSAPPGQPVVISGSGFSKNPSDNVVLFGSIRAEVISADESTIHCVVPDMHFPTWYVPITVTTSGLRSRDHAHIHVDVRVVPNEGIPMN